MLSERLVELTRRRSVRLGTMAALLLASGVAVGFPWDVDMADMQTVKSYEAEMRSTPEGSVAQPSPFTPREQSLFVDRFKPEGDLVTHDLEVDAAMIAQGAKMYGIYCLPCHGDGKELGPVAQPGRLAGVIPLFGTMSTLPSRSDGYIYLTIKNGGMIMPSYGWAMNDAEMWSIVEWLRTQPKAARAGG